MAERAEGERDRASSPQERIAELVHRLVETEAELHALTAGQVDAIVDPEGGTPILLRQAQEALRQAHAELEGRIRERTADLARANEALRTEAAEREQAQADLALYAGRLEIMSRMDRAILAAHTQKEIAEVALGHLRRLLDCRRASVTLFDFGSTAGTGTMQVIATSTDGESQVDLGWRGPLPSPLLLDPLREGRVQVVEELADVPAKHPAIQALQGEGIHTCIIAPLGAGEGLFGTLMVGMEGPASEPAGAVDVVGEVAVQLAVGIQQARLRDELQHHAGELEEVVARRTAQLRASEARNRTIFEAAGVGIAVIDAHGSLRDTNPMLQAMLGYSGEELAGMSYARFLLPEHVRAKEPTYRRLMAGELVEEPFCREVRYLPRSGPLRWGQVTVSLVREPGSHSRLAIAMLQDITEQKQTLEALVQAEKLAVTGQLTALLAHEINNPLQSVVGCLGLASTSLAAGKDPGSYVAVARREVRRVSNIVAQLRDMNRDSRKEEHQPAAVNALVGNALELVAGQCQRRNVHVSWEPAAGLPRLSLVADRIQQVFLNLALQAIAAMPTGGRLNVRSLYTAEPAGVEVSIADSGPGTSQGLIARLFEPFKGNEPLVEGLGLYISNRIVEEHGGRLDVESQPGEGTTFRVWLPA